MKKSILVLFMSFMALVGCDTIGSEEPELANIKDMFVNSDSGGLFVGLPVKLWVALEDLPKNGDWKYDFILNGSVVETINANQEGGVITFYEFTPEDPGTYTYKGTLYSDKESVSNEVTFTVADR